MDTPTLPREFAPGNFWLGGCIEANFAGEKVHTHVSTYLLVGDEKVAMIDTGHPKDWATVEAGLDSILGDRPIDYICPTHQEMPHAGNVARLMAKYPAAWICGDIHDYHLYYPWLEEYLHAFKPGESLDLGGRHLHFVDALIRDMPTTLWAFDDRTGALFVADGYSYTHEHLAGQCALLAEELPHLPSSEQTRFINERALYWTRFVEMDNFFEAMKRLRCDLAVRIIAPAHGSVVTDPTEVLPALEKGYI